MLLLHCSNAYYHIQFNYNVSPDSCIQIIYTYNKYLNCEPLNKFKASFIYNFTRNQIDLLVVECQQNINTVRLEEFESINSASVDIVTGYLQIYTAVGPMCGSASTYFPIRIM